MNQSGIESIKAALPASKAVTAFHDERVAKRTWAAGAATEHESGVWQWIEANHRWNNRLWDEEDLARRTDVADAEIAANKRAIDGFNQKRNDAIERIDEHLLAMLAAAGVDPDAAGPRLNSETAGSMVDRLSILSLKLFHMRLQTERTDASPEHVASCRQRLARLQEQRADLAGCLDGLLADCLAGRARFQIYRQFKMYNDPTMNPYLYGKQG